MSKTYQFPSFYDMPPSFTIQPVLSTRKKQLQLWIDLICDYSKMNKKYEYDLVEVAKTALFHNARINRKLSVESIRMIFDEVVSQGYGEWNKEKSRISIYWRKPEEWGNLIYKWVMSLGKLNSVLTVYEIQQGSDAEGQEFYELETRILLKSLNCLEKQGKAQVFTGSSEDNLGVKFFSV